MTRSSSIACSIAAFLSVTSISAFGQQGTPGSTTGNAFNPSIGLILAGTYGSFKRDPEDYELPGFALGEETDPGPEGFSLGETELSLGANIDERFYGNAVISLTPEGTADVEEAYFETLALGQGFTVKAGRFYSSVGYLNSVHSHAWDFVDQPLVYRAMLANQMSDDGVQVRWVAPTPLFLEIGGEALRGDSFPAGGAAHDGSGTKTAFVHVGGDVGVSNSWRAGVSYIRATAADRETGATPDVFTGDSDTGIFDFIWKWAPRVTAPKPAPRHLTRHDL